jgi:hypothetical protein
MLPRLILPLHLDAVCLGEPLTQPENSLIDILLKKDRGVKGALGLEGVHIRLWQSGVFGKPLEGASRFLVDFDFPGADPGFAFEPLGGHEKVKQGDQRCIDSGQAGLFLKPFEPVVADIFTDDGAVFLFDETVVVFLVVP